MRFVLLEFMSFSFQPVMKVAQALRIVGEFVDVMQEISAGGKRSKLSNRHRRFPTRNSESWILPAQNVLGTHQPRAFTYSRGL
jgi:hypothetical protein